MKNIKISVNLPNSWAELSDGQLYYVYGLIADNLSAGQIKAYCFFRWTGIKIIGHYGDGWEIARGKQQGFIYPGVIAAALHVLDWLDELPKTPVRLASIGKHKAVDATLQGLSFEKYLYCDNLYQGFLSTQSHALLVDMAKILYDSEHISLNNAEKMSIFYWWAGVKALFSQTFVNFLTPLSTQEIIEGGKSLYSKLQQAMNAQIRALTGGDVTKHRQVLDLDVWTALWELDAKAAECKEISAKYGSK